MIEEKVTFESNGLRLSGVVRLPPNMEAGSQRPAFLVLHGFGANKNAGTVLGPCDMLSELGYVTLRFDMRGCGESEGDRGRLICLEQVEDTKSAYTFLSKHPAVTPGRIAVVGSSFGAAVAVYTAGVDQRFAAVISSGGWGDGERKFRNQHAGPEAWAKFTKMLDDGRKHREATGESLMVPRYDIVPIPPHLRGNLAPGAIQSFPVETAQSMFDFRADDVIGQIAPRPTLLLHSSSDSVTPTEQSVQMFLRSQSPTDLHLFAETDHFMFAESNTRVRTVVREWLAQYFPAQ